MSEALAKEYETVFVLRSDTQPGNVEKISGRVQETIKKEGGLLTLVETWGRRQLAYPVQKQKRGIYYCVKYVGGGELVSELERQLRLLDAVMKFQTVMVREEVDRAALEVNPDDVAFESIEADDDYVEASKAQELGLVEAPRRERDEERDDRGSGDRGSGDRGSGDRGSGDRGSGDKGSADKGAGDKGAGDKEEAADDKSGGKAEVADGQGQDATAAGEPSKEQG